MFVWLNQRPQRGGPGAGTVGGGGDVELRESENLSRAWWQSAAAGQAVIAGLRPGQSEEPNNLVPASRASKYKYVR